MHKTLEDVEKDHIIKVMKRYKNAEIAASILGITKTTIYKKFYKYNLKWCFKNKLKTLK